MHFQAILIAVAFVLSIANLGFSQTKSSGASQKISADLLEAYRKTQTVTTEAEVTAIARVCSKAVPDTKRSKADREYAASLLAWSLNRRGPDARRDSEARCGARRLRPRARLPTVPATCTG